MAQIIKSGMCQRVFISESFAKCASFRTVHASFRSVSSVLCLESCPKYMCLWVLMYIHSQDVLCIPVKPLFGSDTIMVSFGGGPKIVEVTCSKIPLIRTPEMWPPCIQATLKSPKLSLKLGHPCNQGTLTGPTKSSL